MKPVVFLMIFSVSLNVIAECTETSCISKVSQILITKTETRVRPTDSETEMSKLDCTPRDGRYLILPVSDNSDRIYSTILAAQKSETKIMYRIVNGSNPCQIGYIRSYSKE